MVGIYIHNVKDLNSRTDMQGNNPFDNFTVSGKPLSQFYRFYDWVTDNGYENFAKWVENAAQAANK